MSKDNILISNKNLINNNKEISNNTDNTLRQIFLEENEFMSFKEQIYLFINIIPMKNINFNFKKIYPFIGKEISKLFDIDTKRIFIKYNDKFENLVNTKNFIKLPISKFLCENPKFKSLYELKDLYENLLLKEYDLPEYIFDYKLNRIEHINNVCHYGIGLQTKYNEIKNKYNNDENWVTIYRGINSILSSNGIEFVLKSILCKEILKTKKKYWKDDNKVSLCLEIKEAIQKYCELITFNKKDYVIVLEGKVNYKYIKNPIDKIDKELINFYRILIIEYNNLKVNL